MSTFAAIDIGSNAIRLLINYVEGGKYKKAAFVRVPIRLGEDVFTTGSIGRQKTVALIEAMAGFASMMRVFGVEDYRACATSAMREASNGGRVVRQTLKKTGLRVEIISGQEEAELIFEAAVEADSGFAEDKSYLSVDVGGGSTEVTVYSNRARVASESFALGTVRMISGATREEETERFAAWLQSATKAYRPVAIVGSGGNINKIAKILEKKEESLRQGELKALLAKLNKLSYEERVSKCGLNTYRADVIMPALEIFLTAARTCKIDEIIVPKIGLADGIIHRLSLKANKNATPTSSA